MDSRSWANQVENFLTTDAGFVDRLSVFSWQVLREFLAPAKRFNAYAPNAIFPFNSCRILYHALLEDPSQSLGTSPMRTTSRDLQRQRNVEEIRTVFDDKSYLKHSNSHEAFRTTIYITDISPVCLATLMIKENIDFIDSFRSYAQCHLGGEVSFVALKPTAHNAAANNVWPRHIAVERKFTYEFHLPYVVVRDRNKTVLDPRGLREWAPMIEALDPAQDAYEQQNIHLACYNTCISLLVIGRDEYHWKAYCNVDTWFGGTLDADECLSQNLDAPTGDARLASDPCTNPREYFLMVLAHRMRQISQEWGNVSTALCQRLAAYEAHYIQSIENDKADLHDDKSMTRTRSYSKAAAMLRQYHDTLSYTLDSFEAFMEANNDLYEQQDDFGDRCGCYKAMIQYQTAHLSRLRRRFLERMQRFEAMRDSLMTASVLRESRQFTRQSEDIELLTKVTVAYLPFSLAAAVLGMSENMPTKSIWWFWFLLSFLLIMATILGRFRLRTYELIQRMPPSSGHWLRRAPRNLASTRWNNRDICD